ncbi:SDR family oxidoreductase [Streptomyces sp. NPDC018059]|uniref:SDR family oxidoreductase n=1 Tax=Streptomyces sp. NPDC018059 TaxID=3365041 RepID=UPI00378FBBA9
MGRRPVHQRPRRVPRDQVRDPAHAQGAAQRGVIICTSSSAAEQARPNSAAYTANKRAVQGIVKSAALAYGRCRRDPARRARARVRRLSLRDGCVVTLDGGSTTGRKMVQPSGTSGWALTLADPGRQFKVSVPASSAKEIRIMVIGRLAALQCLAPIRRGRCRLCRLGEPCA